MRNSKPNTMVGLAGLLIALAGGVPAGAQTSEVALPVSSLECLLEHRQKYLDLPRNVIIFFASLCPAVSREEVAQIVQNSARPGHRQDTRLIILKSDFNCLVDQIAAHLESRPEAPTDPGAEMTFTLNCD